MTQHIPEQTDSLSSLFNELEFSEVQMQELIADIAERSFPKNLPEYCSLRDLVEYAGRLFEKFYLFHLTQATENYTNQYGCNFIFADQVVETATAARYFDLIKGHSQNPNDEQTASFLLNGVNLISFPTLDYGSIANDLSKRQQIVNPVLKPEAIGFPEYFDDCGYGDEAEEPILGPYPRYED